MVYGAVQLRAMVATRAAGVDDGDQRSDPVHSP